MTGRTWKRGNRWVAILELGRDEAGQRKTRWQGGFQTKKEAAAWLAEQTQRAQMGSYVEASKQRTSEFLREWLETSRSTVRATTHDSYRRIIEQHLLAHLSATPLQKLDGAALNRMYAAMLATGRKDGKGGLSPRTVRYAHVIVHRAMADAVRWNRIARNPADQADPPRQSRRKAKSWTSAEVGRFLTHVKDERLYPLWLLAVQTGMRRSELLGLRWSDVSWNPPRVTVVQTLVSVGYRLQFGEPKSHRSERPVGLDPRTAAALKAWRARQAGEKMALGAAYKDQGLVFTTPAGDPIHPDRMSQMFERLVKAAGLPTLPLHGLRHSHASTLLAAGVHPKVVQERLGHSSVAFTLDVYSHLGPEMDKEAAEKAAALVFGSRE